jgi:hypothetical protein
MAQAFTVRRDRWLVIATIATTMLVLRAPATAHHSFAMYDPQKTYVFTGVVTRVTPDANHLQIYFSPLDESRKRVYRDASGQPFVWVVELRAAGTVAREGVTVESFPAGTIFSVGLHPLRTGRPAGGRGEFGLFKCPPRTPPAPGRHCDSVAGATSHGKGVLPKPTHTWSPGGKGVE